MVSNGKARSAALTSLCVGLAAFLCSTPGVSQQKSTDAFIGTWSLNSSQSHLHKGEHYVTYLRTYELDGDRIRVSWSVDYGNGKGEKDSYSAKCDGTLQPAYAGSKIRCWKVDGNTVDGEMVNSDPLHRYYRRQVSADRRLLSLIWYSDSTRQVQGELMVFDRVR